VTEVLVPPLQRWLLFAGSLLLTGAVSWRGFIAPRVRFRLTGDTLDHAAEHPAIARLERAVASWGLVASLALLVAWALRLHVQVVDFRDPFAPLSEDLRLLLFQTNWGAIWFAQGAVILLALPTFLILRFRAGSTLPPPPGLTPEGVPRTTPPPLELPLRWKVAGGLVLLLLLSLSLSSHAMSVPGSRALAVSADMSHAGAAGIWVGSLALILLSHRRESLENGLLEAQLSAFSPVAMVAVGILLIAGLPLSAFHVHEIPALWESRYGLTLSLKVLVALSVMGIGFWNWRRGLPALRAHGSTRVLRMAALEVGLAAAVLLITAVLVRTPVPPGAH
jgi:putative copper export protein